MAFLKKLKAYIYKLNWIVDVVKINKEDKTVEVDFGGPGGSAIYNIEEVNILNLF